MIHGKAVNYPAAAAGPEGLWPGGSCGALKFNTYFHVVIPAPYQVRGKLQQESRVSREGGNPVTFCSSLFSQRQFWTPAFAGVTVI